MRTDSPKLFPDFHKGAMAFFSSLSRKKKNTKTTKFLIKKNLTNKIRFSSQAIYWYGTFTGGQSGWAFPRDLCRELPSLRRVFPLKSALAHSLGSNLRLTSLEKSSLVAQPKKVIGNDSTFSLEFTFVLLFSFLPHPHVTDQHSGWKFA